MKYDFDQLIERKNTSSLKWDFNEQFFGDKDVLPLWLADMDFLAPEPVVEALKERAAHGIYGYANGMNSYYDAVINWMKRRHQWDIQKDWIIYSPGIVPALNWLVRALAKPGDQVVVQTPVYHPFFAAIKGNGCEIANNALKYENGRYVMDYEDLELKFSAGAKLLILCSPHNPVGRVWTREELERVGELCLKYDVTVISDEIHADVVYAGHKHIPLAAISEELAQKTITCTAPSKTFNLAGLQTANIISANPALRQAFKRELDNNGVHGINPFGISALEAAYNHGDEWLDELLVYLEGNAKFVIEFMETRMPKVRTLEPEGTYLMWLDFKALGREPKALQDFLVQKAQVGLNAGFPFGLGGEGFERLNIGCPRSILAEGLARIERAVNADNGGV